MMFGRSARRCRIVVSIRDKGKYGIFSSKIMSVILHQNPINVHLMVKNKLRDALAAEAACFDSSR